MFHILASMKKLLLCSLIFSFAVFAKSHASPSEKGSPGGISLECASYDATVSVDVINVDMKVSANYLMATSDLVSVDAVSKSVKNACDITFELLNPETLVALKRSGWNRGVNNEPIYKLNKSYLTSAPVSNLMNGNYCSLRS